MKFLNQNSLFQNSALSYLLIVIMSAALTGCQLVQNQLVKMLSVSGSYEAQGDPSSLSPQFFGDDLKREQVAISLTKVASAVQPTDIAFSPVDENVLFILEKQGQLKLVDLNSREEVILQTLSVTSSSEQGLLGIAFHPQFQENGLYYLNYTTVSGDQDVSRISEFKLEDHNDGSPLSAKATAERVLMEVEQPYANHNAGQIAFGPDGMLYIGWGDGGWADDPREYGQKMSSLLGKMLRIDVRPGQGAPYQVPTDNPFLDQSVARPEIYAVGLRNPWRFSFTPQGELVVADVGQNKFEEINIVESGKNYGWSVTEGFACLKDENCKLRTYESPVYQYGRAEGKSITGGFVYFGSRIDALQDRYIFGDFISGRLWAIELPDQKQRIASKGVAVQSVQSLGQWPVLPSTFGQDKRGEVYMADFGSGSIFRLDPGVALSKSTQKTANL